MKTLIISIFLLLFLALASAGPVHSLQVPELSPDTLPPPPPGGNMPLTGPGQACTGDTSLFFADVPVACSCQWIINSILQPETGSSLTVVWTQAGSQIVELNFLCENGLVSPAGNIEVEVSEDPGQPGQIQGETSVCEYTTHTYTTAVGPFDTCQWTVNGAVQPYTGPAMTYSFGSSGIYAIEVISFNLCGTSIPRIQEVVAQGAAPAPPGPITGPEESCTGNLDTYTANPEPGLSCLWWIDGIQQPDTTTVLVVDWSESGLHIIEARAVSECGTGNPAFIDVMVWQPPQVGLGPDTSILSGQSLILDAGNPGSGYLWSTGQTTQTIEVTQAGNYSVTVTNFCGEDWDDIQVSIITGMPGELSGFEGKIYYDGEFVRTDPGKEKILYMKISNISGQIFYEGDHINLYHPEYKGLIIITLFTSYHIHTSKLLIH